MKPHARRRRRTTLAPLALALALLPLAAGAASPSTQNLLPNGSFEGTTTGWAATNARVELVAGGVSGAQAARVASVKKQAGYAVVTSPRPVGGTVAGTVYEAGASIRGLTRTLCLRIREYSPSGTLLGSAQSCLTGSGTWRALPPVAYTARGGGSVDVLVHQATKTHAGDWFELDAVSLTAASPGDATPPDTAVDAGPSGTTTETDATFSFSASEAGSTFECSLDGAGFAACSSPRAYGGLAAGEHVFRVRATDAAGNVDPTPAERSWTISAPAPSGTTELVVNGSFESSLDGWDGYRATLSRVGGAPVGAYAARAALVDASTSFSIFPVRPQITSTTAGTELTAAAWVRGAAGKTLCLRVRETASGTVVGSALACVTATGTWQQIPAFAYTTVGAGNALDAYVYLWGSVAGDAFEADGVSLTTAGASEEPPPPPPPPPPPSSEPFAATATDHAHVRLDWAPVDGAASYRLRRGTIELARLGAGATTYTDALLWPFTSYGWTLEALGADGAVIATRSATAATTPLPAGGFPRPFAATSFWNTPVGSQPLNARNADLSGYLAANAKNPNITLNSWGVSVAESQPGDPSFSVPCTRYTCTLSAFGAFRIPLIARPDPSGDGHFTVYDPATLQEWDMWQGVRAPDGSSWSASAGAAVSMADTGVAPPNTGAGNAANFPNLGGLIRPEEILQGRIDHALVVGIPGIGEGPPVCPATHNAPTTTDPNALREGHRIQLDPSIDVNALAIPAWQRPIARALQVYGAYVRDNSGSLAVYAETPHSRGYNPWTLLGLSGNPSLAGIPWDRFRVLAAPDHPDC